MGVGLGIQLVPLGSFGFFDRQHITDVILLSRNGIAIGIGLNGFHHSTIQRNGVLRTGKRIQTVILNLIDAGLGSIDGLFQRNRLGVFRIGEGNGSRSSTYGNLSNFHITAGIDVDFIAIRSLYFFQKIRSAVQTGPPCLAGGIRLAGTYVDITGIGGVEGFVVCTGNGRGTRRIAVQSELCTRQISCACRVGLGHRDFTGASTVGSPIASKIIKSIGPVFCSGIHLGLDSVDKACSKQVGRSLLCPDRSAMSGIVLTAKH